MCQALGRPRRRLYGRRQSGSGQPMRRPEVDAAISRRLEASPASEGYRRLDALLTRQGLGCDPNTVRRVMRRHGGFRYLVLFLEEERFVSIVELLPPIHNPRWWTWSKTHSQARGVSRNATSDLFPATALRSLRIGHSLSNPPRTPGDKYVAALCGILYIIQHPLYKRTAVA